MAKIKAPLFSLDATGTLDKNITYKENKQNKIAQKYSKPGSANPFESSPRQKDQRSIIRLITIHWQCMTDLDKLSWETAAKDARFKGTGYHYFLHMAQQNLTQYLGLVGYWSMNYNIDEKIPDLSGNGNHGTLGPIYPCDCPTLVDSFDKKHGKALFFDGVNDYLSISHNSSLNLTTFTIEVLIKRIKSGFWQSIFTKRGGPSVFFDNYSLWYETSNKVMGYVSDGTNFLTVDSGVLDTNIHFLVITCDTILNLLCLYIDGILIKSIPLTLVPAFNSTPILISEVNGYTSPCGCISYEALLWEIALSKEEIKKHFLSYNL